MIYDNILGTIGRTPIVRINRLAPAGTTMYVKCENVVVDHGGCWSVS